MRLLAAEKSWEKCCLCGGLESQTIAVKMEEREQDMSEENNLLSERGAGHERMCATEKCPAF
jgi:hypothetical protein